MHRDPKERAGLAAAPAIPAHKAGGRYHPAVLPWAADRAVLLADKFACCSGTPEGVWKVKLSKSAWDEFGSVAFM